MLATIFLIGVGLIVALGGVILLDRERFDRGPRTTYRMTTLVGAALVLLGIFL